MSNSLETHNTWYFPFKNSPQIIGSLLQDFMQSFPHMLLFGSVVIKQWLLKGYWPSWRGLYIRELHEMLNSWGPFMPLMPFCKHGFFEEYFLLFHFIFIFFIATPVISALYSLQTSLTSHCISYFKDRQSEDVLFKIHHCLSPGQQI